MARKISPQQTTLLPVKPAIYLRVSTGEQAESGLGLAAQLDRCNALVLAKGWPAAYVYKDEGISGTLGPDKRPGLAMLLDAIKAGTINAVVVLDLSRLGRSVKLVTSLIEELDSHNAAFVSCKENFDTSTAMGRAMLGIVAVFGQLERDLTSERTTAALGERRRRHGYASGPLPLGYGRIAETEEIIVDSDQRALVRSIFALHYQGRSLRGIAATLNGRPAVAGAPERWYASTVKVVLGNEARYRGKVPSWPAIL